MKIKKLINFGAHFVLGQFQSIFGLEITSTPTNRLALNQWLSKTKPLPNDANEILITAFRNQTWIEWGVYAACVFNTLGYKSTILYRSSEVKRYYSTKLSFLNFWKGVSLIPNITLIDVESADLDEKTRKEFLKKEDGYFAAAIAYDFHVEKDDILNGSKPEYFEAIETLRNKTAETTAVIARLLKDKTYHRFILYSGLISDSRGALDIAIALKQELVCIEGWSWRPGHIIYNYNAPALEYNVQGWMKILGEWNEQKEKEINSYIKFLDGEKVHEPGWLDNFYLVQRSKISAEFSPELKSFISGDAPIAILAPNVIGDSSLLNRETIFRSMRLWINEVIEYFKNNPDKKLIIRAHPAEVWVDGPKLVIRVGEYAKEISMNIPNVFVLDGKDKTNTFSLLPFSRVGLVWISSVGFDMVIRGIPVISAANAKYSGLGIVEEPINKEEYFNLLEKLMATQYRPHQQQIQKGKEFQYMVFKGFSFQAQGINYRANTCAIGKMPNQEEHDKFYRIVLGEETVHLTV